MYTPYGSLNVKDINCIRETVHTGLVEFGSEVTQRDQSIKLLLTSEDLVRMTTSLNIHARVSSIS